MTNQDPLNVDFAQLRTLRMVFRLNSFSAAAAELDEVAREAARPLVWTGRLAGLLGLLCAALLGVGGLLPAVLATLALLGLRVAPYALTVLALLLVYTALEISGLLT